MLHHMLDSKRKKLTLPCGELITQFFYYTGYDFEEEKLEFMYRKIGMGVISKMGYDIQGRETVPLPPRRARQ